MGKHRDGRHRTDDSLSGRLAALLIIGVALVLAGCATTSRYQNLPALASDVPCRQLLTEAEQRVEATGRADPLGHPVPGYPYLRSDRLSASFAGELGTPDAFEAWFETLYRAGAAARRYSLDNLPPAVRFSAGEREAIEGCIARLAERDRAVGAAEALPQRAAVPDAYSSWMRALGLFPLTRLVVLYQVERWKQRWQPQFNAPRWRAAAGTLYTPPPATALQPDAVASWLQQARAAHPLGWPLLSASRQDALLDWHAPAWWAVQRSGADRIGRPYWRDGLPEVAADDPVSYRWTSLTRFRNRTLLQLNYLIWFPERPPQRQFDLYAGRLDGLIWRVTLDAEGRVLLYDSIHPCGCYHLVFPLDPRLQPRQPGAHRETPLILTEVLPPDRSDPLLLQVTPADHYLIGVGRLEAQRGTAYRHAPYDRLRSLPFDGGTRGLFAPDGLVTASARPERFLLWPMGIPSAGASRVRSDLAISFANRRHFDDPRLIEELFEWVEVPGPLAPGPVLGTVPVNVGTERESR